MNTDYRPTNSWDFRLRAAKVGELVSMRSLAALSLTVALIALLATLATLLAPPLQAQTTTEVEVPSNWSLTPPGLAVGDQFRLLFLSSTTNDATSTDIADYNAFIKNLAATGHVDLEDYSEGFQVVGCTAAVDAQDNTGTNINTDGAGVPVYWVNGSKAADDNTDFYDGNWDDEANDKNELGNNGPDTSQPDNYPFTGCNHNGTESIFSGTSLALGQPQVRLGAPNHSTANYGPLSSTAGAAKTTRRPMYGISQVFEVLASHDATLSALTLEGADGGETITLSPAFDADTETYTAAVVNRIDAVKLTATKNDDNAMVVITNDDDGTAGEAVLDLNVGSNTLTVTVTAQNGTATLTYTITATRAAAPPAPTDCPDDTTWCTTMTLGHIVKPQSITIESFGYDENNNYGDLGTTTFTRGGTSYRVTFLDRTIRSFDDTILFDTFGITVIPELPDGSVLQVDNLTFTVDAGSRVNDGLEDWDLPAGQPLSWTKGQHVTVSLKLPAVPITLVSNTHLASNDFSSDFLAQRFTTGANAAGYTVSQVDIHIYITSGTSTSVRIRENNADNEPGNLVATLTNPGTLTTDSRNTFTAPAGTTLAASTTYWITTNEGISSDRVSYLFTPENNQTGEPGWTIGDDRLRRTDETDRWGTNGTSLLITIKGTAIPTTTLVSNTHLSASLDTNLFLAQSFETGTNLGGYTVSEVDIRLATVSGKSTSVKIRKNNAGERAFWWLP